jgi:hypothetical protein
MSSTHEHEKPIPEEEGTADVEPNPDSMSARITIPDDEDVEPGSEEYPQSRDDGHQDDGED